MIGAILGDVIGSRFEGRHKPYLYEYKSKEFKLFETPCRATDDSMMTMAIAKALFLSRDDFSKLAQNSIKCMQEFGRQAEHAGYGRKFKEWIFLKKPMPYNSFGNGAAMRVSPVAFVANSIEECKTFSKAVTEVTHNHPEGMKGAECEAVCVFMAKNGASKKEIQEHVQKNYYDLNFDINEARDAYQFDVSCQGSLPQSIKCFLESTDFEDCIRNCVSFCGDTDTMGAMAGAIAEAFYKLPDSTHKTAERYCPPEMFCYVQALEYLYNGYKGELIKETKELLGL